LKGRIRGTQIASAWLAGAALVALTAISGCRSHDFPDVPANYREFAYVTNGSSDTVSVIDAVNVRLDREIQVGHNPVAVVASPTRNEVYVVNAGRDDGKGSISVIDSVHNSMVASIVVQRQPRYLEIDSAGEFGYVANSGSNSVSIIDLAARREIAVIGAGQEPAEVRISPDGKSLVVPNRKGNSVSILDVATRSLRHVIDGCPGASDAVILPDSSKAFVSCSGGHQIVAIALAETANAGHTARPDALEAFLDVGQTPMHLALKPDGGELFVFNSESDSISEVITGTNDVGGAYLMGSGPIAGLVSSDNSLLYVSNSRSQDVSLFAIDDGKRGKTIHVGDGPAAMAFSSSGHLLFTVDTRSGDVAVIRASSGSLFTFLPTGREPNAIAIKAFRIP
jgi:YVTN family beta-propeller protein